MDKAREVLERGITLFKENHENEMRHQLLLALKSLEEAIEDNDERIASVTKRQAKKVKKVRHDPETGIDEDYIDYIFPDDETNSIQMNMLKAASKWKMNTMKQTESEAKKVKVSETVDIDSDNSNVDYKQTKDSNKNIEQKHNITER